MSNHLAVAAVTATLHHLLHRAARASGVSAAEVRNLRPDADGLPTHGINIFLYQVTPNAALRNADLPTRRGDGTPLRRPQVALDLHYLLTFYGDDITFDPQRLLGAAVRELHAHAVLSRDAVRRALAHFAVLAGADLAEQIDLVRLVPTALSLEELSKLWTVFPKVDYVLSATYVAGVVLIETDDAPPGAPLPVLRPVVTAVPFSLASVDAVEPQPVELSPSPPTAVVLVGSNLDPAAEVVFTTPGKAQPLTGAVQSAADGTRLTVLLPDGLRPGLNTVRLARLAPAPSASVSVPSAAPRVLSQSNAAPFVLRPTARFTPGSPAGSITAVVSPPVGPRQQVALVLNPLSAPASSSAPPGSAPAAFALPAAAHPAETDTFVFDYTNFHGGPIPAGTYLARVRVDEAESGLETGASGNFSGPLVTIP